jgi:hypothetical protein
MNKFEYKLSEWALQSDFYDQFENQIHESIEKRY